MKLENVTYELEYQTLHESHSYIVSPRCKTLDAAKETMNKYLSGNSIMWVKAHAYDSGDRYLYSINVTGEIIEQERNGDQVQSSKNKPNMPKQVKPGEFAKMEDILLKYLIDLFHDDFCFEQGKNYSFEQVHNDIDLLNYKFAYVMRQVQFLIQDPEFYNRSRTEAMGSILGDHAN